jgi:rhodanese-related sulfurtransferase
MKRLIAFGMLLALPMAFAGKTTKTTTKEENFKLIHVTDLAPLVKEHAANLYVFDANNDDTRKKDGIIPGAKLLTSSSKYDIAKTLPEKKDSKLVFYCANTQCMASHAAANRAAKAGYTDVSVMADGIQGWKTAGEPTEKP